MKLTQPLITLSVVSHGNAALVNRLLESLRLYEKTDRLQIILTDNLEIDLPDFDPAPWKSLEILRNKHPAGFARNQNQAFRSAQGKYYCVINPDVIFEEPLLDNLLSRLETGVVDIIAPLVTDAFGNIQDSSRSIPTPWEIVQRRLPGYRMEPHFPDGDGLIRPDWMAGIFLLMPANVYQLLGGFNESYWLYFEDIDFCTRARLGGLRLAVDTNFRIRHDAQRASRRRLLYLLTHLHSALRFFTSDVYRQASGQKKRI